MSEAQYQSWSEAVNALVRAAASSDAGTDDVRPCRLFLYGPPGVGKSRGAVEALRAAGVGPIYRVGLTPELAGVDLLGTARLAGDPSGGVRSEWVPGALARWVRDGGGLIVDEVGRASADALAVLLGALDDAPSVTLPDGSVWAADPGRVRVAVLTSNDSPDDLPDALRDRFDAILAAGRPSDAALRAIQSDALRSVVEAAGGGDARREWWAQHAVPIGIRQAVAYERLIAAGVDAALAVRAVFGAASADVAAALADDGGPSDAS